MMPENPNPPHYERHIFMCINQKAPGKTCCANTGGLPYVTYLQNVLKAQDLSGPGKVRVSQSGCLGRCKLGPCLVIYPEGIWYTYSSTDDLDEIIQTHVLEGKLCTQHLIDVKERC
ncbi:MAG: (2Fe-2S) ferredoxin domain-containing protein [Legionellaceae bacterium]|nr:(2Fe-2S) ferredoxin domain-containing protein [Legionellaceae bacterium]